MKAEDIDLNRMQKTLIRIHEHQPQTFESLLSVEGVGPKTVRSLSLVAELIFGARPSFRDPARFSFAHGGKDGYPYPVDRKNYDRTIELLHGAVQKAKIGQREKVEALKRLARFTDR